MNKYTRNSQGEERGDLGLSAPTSHETCVAKSGPWGAHHVNSGVGVTRSMGMSMLHAYPSGDGQELTSNIIDTFLKVKKQFSIKL